MSLGDEGLPGALPGGRTRGRGCQVERQQAQKLNDQKESDVLYSLVQMCTWGEFLARAWAGAWEL